MKSTDLTIAIFVLGSSIKFDKKKLKRSDGSNEYYKLIETLAKRTSIKNIILLSRSDFSKLSTSDRKLIDPRGIIIDPYQDRELWNKPKTSDLDIKYEFISKLYDKCHSKYHIDYGIGFISQGFYTVSALPGFLNTCTFPHTRAKVLDMCLYYSSPIVHYLNKSMMKWYMIGTDPRYIKKRVHFRDTANIPVEIIGQYEFDVEWKGIPEYRKDIDEVKRIVKSKYSGIEKTNLIGEETIPYYAEKDNKFAIVSLQLTPESAVEDERFSILKEWILDKDSKQETKIFGKWSSFFKTGYPQFQGYVSTEDLDNLLKRTRYTLVLPTKDKWVTSKYAEMLLLGVIPFLHPNYDDQYHIVDKNHYIRVNSPEEFYEKMNELDRFPNIRMGLLEQLQNKLISGCYDGQFLIDIFNEANIRNNIQCQIGTEVIENKLVEEIKLF